VDNLRGSSLLLAYILVFSWLINRFMSLAAFSKLVNASIVAEFFQLCHYHQHMIKFERIYKKIVPLIFTAASLITLSNAI
jgi:hypothetical protein